MIAVIENEKMEINGKELPVSINKEAPFYKHFSDKKDSVEFMGKIVKLLDALHIKQDIIISEMKKEDWETIKILIQAIVDKKTVSLNEKKLQPLIQVKVQKIIFRLLVTEIEPGIYRMSDFFSNDYNFLFVCEEGEEKVPISAYYILNREDYANLVGIDYNRILKDFQVRCNNNPKSIDLVILSLLEVIHGYDICKNSELLIFARHFAEWINEIDKQEITIINCMQIYKRERQLTEEEKDVLFEINETTSDKRIKAAVALLLDNFPYAEKYLSALNDIQKEEFVNYPIYFFMQTKDDASKEVTFSETII